MFKNYSSTIVFLFLFSFVSSSTALASEIKGFEEIPRTALTGTLIGSCLGLHHYGISKNQNPNLILIHAAYGLVGGTVIGAGMDLIEFRTSKNIAGDYINQVTALGAIAGAFTFCMYAVIPYALNNDDRDNFYHGSMGLGLGGMIGATAGLTVALATMPDPDISEPAFSAKIGIQPETRLLNLKTSERFDLVCYRIIDIQF